jgi:hypothetical protein
MHQVFFSGAVALQTGSDADDSLFSENPSDDGVPVGDGVGEGILVGVGSLVGVAVGDGVDDCVIVGVGSSVDVGVLVGSLVGVLVTGGVDGGVNGSWANVVNALYATMPVMAMLIASVVQIPRRVVLCMVISYDDRYDTSVDTRMLYAIVVCSLCLFSWIAGLI